MSKIDAIIFDMDGVLSDTQPIHSKVEAKLLSKYGVKISPEEITEKYSGVKTNEFFHELLKGKLEEREIDALLDKKWDMLITETRKKVNPINGALELVRNAKKKGFKIAVASASITEYVHNVLESLGIMNEFEIIVTGDDVKQGKPNPEIFLKAAEMLDVSPEKCIVIEDAASGMTAAKRAGMKCIGLVKDRARKDIYPADILVESLLEINFNNIF